MSRVISDSTRKGSGKGIASIGGYMQTTSNPGRSFDRKTVVRHGHNKVAHTSTSKIPK